MKLNKTRFSAWLVLVALPAFAAKVETVKIPSGAMEKEIPATVILPDAYATNSAQHFPVLFLLHGAGDNHQGWVSRVPAIKDEADRRQFIIVCPNAELSWYYDSPVNPKIKYETFCSTELVQWADSQYPTITNRQARATCGLSMGGHGALWLAIRHRDTFGTAVALSGGVDVRPFNDWNLPGLLGSKTEQKENWETHAVVSLVPTLKNGDLAISLDCGAGDFFLAVNRDLHQRLLTAKIDHDYSERPGDHNWDYWTKTFPYAAQFIGTQFKRIKAELNLIPATPTSPAPKPGDADCPQPSPSARHTEKVAAVQSGDYDLVLIGDSITHTLDNFGGKYDALNGVWNKHYAPRNAINLGHNGYRTEQVLWNLHNGELDFKKSPKVFVILLGTNNADSRNFPRAHTGLEIFNGIRAIVELIKERHPTSKILLLRPFPKGLDTQRHEATSPPVFSFSQSDVEAARQAGELISRLADDKQVFWLDVNHVFLRPDGTINVDVMWDLLHPNAAGAEAWAQAIEPTLARLMGDLPIVDPQTNSAVVPVSKLENDSYDWFARHAEVLRIKNTINPEVVLIGDSITHFWGGEPKAKHVNGPKSWQSAFGKYRTLNLGFGWDRTQNVLWRLDHGELDSLHPRIIVLHIGTNNTSDTGNARQNTPEEIAEGIRQIIIRIRSKVPAAKIILMAVFPRDQKPDAPRRAQIAGINKLIAEFGKTPGVSFLDIGPKLLQPDGTISRQVMGDFCHPTEDGYQIWSDALIPLLN